MKKVLVATDKPFAAVAVNQIRSIIEKAGFELALLEKYTDKSQLIDAVKTVNAVIIRSDLITREVIEASDTLEIVVRAGAGYDNVDLKAATEKKVVVMNTPGQNSNAVAELAFEMMLYHARKGFAGLSGVELRDKTLGIHAYGNVGKYVARIAHGFGMKVYAFDPYVPAESMKADQVGSVKTAEELYEKSQYISLHIPANEQTKKSINYSLLRLMPKNAVLVNTARKEVINEADLLKLMEERGDFSYLTDIEPDTKADFVKFEGRYLATAKKMGAQTSEANINAGIAAANQIVAFFKEGNTTFQVNK
jgi:D-3-phosphoglycerate dehydrogenase / 2-oxoglutarate reductase